MEYRNEVDGWLSQVLGEPDTVNPQVDCTYAELRTLALHAIALGVRLGIEAAAAAVDDTDLERDEIGGMYSRDDAHANRASARRNVLALDPRAVLGKP